MNPLPPPSATLVTIRLWYGTPSQTLTHTHTNNFCFVVIIMVDGEDRPIDVARCHGLANTTAPAAMAWRNLKNAFRKPLCPICIQQQQQQQQ